MSRSPSPVRPLEVGVVGCGVAGQAAAILLSRQGHRVTVFERFAEPRPVGAGLLLQPTGLAVLAALGLAEQALARGARVHGLQARTASGRAVLDLDYRDLHPAAHGLGIRRADLFDLLHGALKASRATVVTGLEIAAVEGQVLVEGSGRKHGPFDLVIAADGTNSRLRGSLLPQKQVTLYRWGCLWATVPDDGAGFAASGLLQQRVRGTREMMGLLPVAPGVLTLYWSLPTTALNAKKVLDLDDFRRRAGALWPEAAPLVARAADGELVRATYRHVALSRWNKGGVLLIGDAGHGTSPQLGQGANLGLMDAWVLADALAEGPDLLSAVMNWERRREATLFYYQRVSHLLTPFFQSRAAPLGWLRDLALGPVGRLGPVRRLMTTTLAGTRRGWWSSVALDDEGRYPLPPGGRA